jgi:hypothetical protein
MAFDNRTGAEKRTLENVSLSYSLDSILVSLGLSASRHQFDVPSKCLCEAARTKTPPTTFFVNNVGVYPLNTHPD